MRVGVERVGDLHEVRNLQERVLQGGLVRQAEVPLPADQPVRVVERRGAVLGRVDPADAVDDVHRSEQQDLAKDLPHDGWHRGSCTPDRGERLRPVSEPGGARCAGIYRVRRSHAEPPFPGGCGQCTSSAAGVSVVPVAAGVAVRRGKAIAAVSAPRAATANITQNAAWKAFTPACETRTVDTAATPTAPPISRMVSTSPDARPVIECVTPDRAPICAAGAASPPATPAKSSAGNRSVA